MSNVLKRTLAVAGVIAGLSMVSAANASIVLTGSSPNSLDNDNFDRLVNPLTATNPVSPTASGGTYYIESEDAVASCASGSNIGKFALTIQNNTGSEITSLTLAGNAIQYKRNSTSGASETLTTAVTGALSVGAGTFDVALPSPSAASQVNNPPITAPYSVTLSGISLAQGASFTITWSDANDGGTDALFGLSNMGVSFTNVAIPEPATFGLVSVAGLLGLRRRRA